MLLSPKMTVFICLGLNCKPKQSVIKITPLSTLYNSLILKGLKFNNFLAKIAILVFTGL